MQQWAKLCLFTNVSVMVPDFHGCCWAASSLCFWPWVCMQDSLQFPFVAELSLQKRKRPVALASVHVNWGACPRESVVTIQTFQLEFCGMRTECACFQKASIHFNAKFDRLHLRYVFSWMLQRLICIYINSSSMAAWNITARSCVAGQVFTVHANLHFWSGFLKSCTYFKRWCMLIQIWLMCSTITN